jgi:paraquat-inducible protein B
MKTQKIVLDWLVPFIALAVGMSWYAAQNSLNNNLFS